MPIDNAAGMTLIATESRTIAKHAKWPDLNPCRHCGQYINQQASMLGVIACHKVPIHDQALPKIACDDKAGVEEQHNVQREQKACSRHRTESQ
jgi:hypothetical protein